jgi:hypothetical protein
MPSRKTSYFKQKVCNSPPPCKKGMSSYKMRKSKSRCCRKSGKPRIGPSNVKKSPWLKFLKSHKGKGHSRKQLSKLYRSRK